MNIVIKNQLILYAYVIDILLNIFDHKSISKTLCLFRLLEWNSILLLFMWMWRKKKHVDLITNFIEVIMEWEYFAFKMSIESRSNCIRTFNSISQTQTIVIWLIFRIRLYELLFGKCTSNKCVLYSRTVKSNVDTKKNKLKWY